VTETATDKAALRAYFDGAGFERWAAIYGEGTLRSRVRRTIRSGHRQMLDTAAAWLAETVPVVPPGATALDAGCGTGLFSVRLAERGYAVTASDIAPRMVAAAAQAAQAAGVRDRVTPHTGDLAGVTGRYDAVACFDVLVHYPQPQFGAMLTALAARARGPLLFTYAPHTKVLAALHWIGGRFPQPSRRTEIRMIPEADVRQTLTAAGFVVRRHARVDDGFYHVTLVEAYPKEPDRE